MQNVQRNIFPPCNSAPSGRVYHSLDSKYFHFPKDLTPSPACSRIVSTKPQQDYLHIDNADITKTQYMCCWTHFVAGMTNILCELVLILIELLVGDRLPSVLQWVSSPQLQLWCEHWRPGWGISQPGSHSTLMKTLPTSNTNNWSQQQYTTYFGFWRLVYVDISIVDLVGGAVKFKVVFCSL